MLPAKSATAAFILVDIYHLRRTVKKKVVTNEAEVDALENIATVPVQRESVRTM